jgi:hypothetical protein
VLDDLERADAAAQQRPPWGTGASRRAQRYRRSCNNGDDRFFVGDVMDLADAITFTSRTVDERDVGSATAFDAQLDRCTERGKEPVLPGQRRRVPAA